MSTHLVCHNTNDNIQRVCLSVTFGSCLFKALFRYKLSKVPTVLRLALWNSKLNLVVTPCNRQIRFDATREESAKQDSGGAGGGGAVLTETDARQDQRCYSRTADMKVITSTR